MKVSINFSARASAAIKRLARLNETHDDAKTVGRALAVYECILHEMADAGAVPVLIYPDGSRREVDVK